ncbi:HEPN domain-containing protein [Candidatus Acetothermia bacterium]|jgi:HEPN domain-containing protein|nr:HEPN domain-containing protein [Candidatus Acetothermia bacterium]
MKRETEEWLKIAEEELQAAEHLFKASLYRMVCYHTQQAVEKILKAILTERGIEFSRTHNILDLSNAVKEIGYEVPLPVEDAVFLNSVYRARYPAALGLLPTGEPTKEDADRALHSVWKMRKWLKEVVA